MALVVALAAPLLLASTGLSVDVGYWYQQQESLQSAADSAAVATALSDGVLAQTTASGKQTAAAPLAVAAADGATNSQFGFAAGKGGAGVTVSANITATSSSDASTVTTTQFTATAQIPRGTFFSSVSGVGVAGMVPGKQYASATTQTTSVYGPVCLDATAPSGAGTIYTGNGASTSGFFGANCGFYDNSTNCGGGTNDAIVDSNSPMMISAETIRTAGCAYNGNPVNGNRITASVGGVAQKQTAVPDPYGSMDSGCTSTTTGSCMTWPKITAPGGTDTCLTGELAQTATTSTASSGAGTISSCSGSSVSNFPICTDTYTGGQAPVLSVCKLGNQNVVVCDLPKSYTNEICSVVANSAGTASAVSYLGLGGGTAAAQLNLNCASVSYSVSTNTSIGWVPQCTAPNSNTSAATDAYGGIEIAETGNSGVLNIESGSLVSSMTSCADTSSATQCALIFTGTSLNIGGTFGTADDGTYTFTGGIKLDGSVNPTIENFYAGTYYISAFSGNDDISNPTSGGAMVVASTDDVTFGAVSSGTISPTVTSTYYFNGGLNIIGQGHVTFGPGIYYFENGDLILGQSANVTVDGATFVFEGDAAVVMNGSAQFSMSAPGVAGTAYAHTPCVQPSAFVAGATNGEGICGILFYQARNDSAADTISEGAGGSGNNTIDGEIYAPSAPLTLTGIGTLTAGTSNTFGIIQYSFNSGTTGGKLQVEEPLGNPSSAIVGTTTAQPYLIK